MSDADVIQRQQDEISYMAEQIELLQALVKLHEERSDLADKYIDFLKNN